MRTVQQIERDRKIRLGEAIVEEKTGLIFYPITMRHYEEFLYCKDALTLRMGTLPVRYRFMDYAQALFAMERDLMPLGREIGFLNRLVRLICLALRDAYDGETFNHILLKRTAKEYELAGFRVTQNGREVEIPKELIAPIIRPLIANQNGLVLPNEGENADLIEDYEKKKSLSAPANIDINIDDMIASVAYQSRIAEREIVDWTVREFENRRRAIDRDKRYMLYGQAEMSGMVSFKNGNPAPSWCFDVKDDSLGTMSLDQLQKTLDGAIDAPE